MSTAKFNVKVVSPETQIFEGSAIQVRLPSYQGEMTVLGDHSPVICLLRYGLLEIGRESDDSEDNSSVVRFHVTGGYCKVAGDSLLILCDEVSQGEGLSESTLMKEKDQVVSLIESSDNPEKIEALLEDRSIIESKLEFISG